MEYNKRQQFAMDKLRANIKDATERLAKPRITLDFETRCEIDLKKVGAYNYSAHPSCTVLMMAYSLTGKVEDTRLWEIGDPPPKGLFVMLANGHQLNAFNKYFEMCIWFNVCVPKMGWPKPEVEDFLDTGDKCKALALPGKLETACEVARVEHKKNPDGDALIKFFCLPKTKKVNGKQVTYFHTKLTHPEKWARFCQYCVDDVKATIALDDCLPDLSPMEQLTSWMTDHMNFRGVHVDMAAVAAAKSLATDVKDKYNAEAQELSGGLFEKCTQRAKVKEWLAGQGFSLPNMQGDTINVALRKELKPEIRRMLELYTICGSTASAKFDAMVNYVAGDGRIHELLNYHKARTGRWGGRGIQIQNLPRPTLPKFVDYAELLQLIKQRDFAKIEAWGKAVSAKDKALAEAKGRDTWWEYNPMKILTSCLRAVICSEVGKHFKCADYSSIEARVLLWLAGDKHALNLFRRNEDIYLDMASEIYDVPLEKLTKESDERPLGKEAILGCGYGMADKTFRKRCDEVAGIKISADMAKHTITTYRTKYKSVVDLWRALEKIAMEAVTHPGRVTHFNGIKFVMRKYGRMPILLCRFPSGHTTGYPHAKVVLKTMSWGEQRPALYYEGHDSYTHKWTDLDTYGGKLAENLTQGIARDLMAFGMLLLDAVTYYLVMTVHDETVSEDEDDKGSLADFEMLMCTLPAWASDLPVTSEGWQGDRYRK